MKPAPEWQASYQTMGSLRFPFYHKLSFSSVQIYFFQRQKYLFFLRVNILSISWFLFHQFKFFVFIGANISTISCFLFIIENLYYITSKNFSFSYLAIFFSQTPHNFISWKLAKNILLIVIFQGTVHASDDTFYIEPSERLEGNI